MRLLITGGTGLIGRALARNLAKDGHEVILLSRAPERVHGLPSGVRAVAWDARTAAGWGSLADGAGAIVNLAGASLAGEGFLPTRWTLERRRIIVESRAMAGAAVVEAIEQAKEKPRVVVQASGIGYYGPHGDEILAEEAGPGDDWAAQFAAKIWEASTAQVQEMGVRHVVVRTGIVLSVKGGAFPRLLLPFRLFVGGPMGRGAQWYSWIHLEDEVRAIRFLVEQDQARGPFNLTAPNPVTNREMAREIGRILKRPSFIPVPGFLMRLAFGKVAGVVLEGQRVVPQRLSALGFEFRYEQLTPALQDLLL